MPTHPSGRSERMVGSATPVWERERRSAADCVRGGTVARVLATPRRSDARSAVGAVPGLALLRTYRRKWLGSDLVAGLVVTTLLVPQGMAYAELAGLPPITGLYTTVHGPARLRGVRPVPGPGAGPGLVPRADDRRHPAAAGRRRRRPRAGRGLRLGAGADGRGDHGAGRGVPARVRGGPALPADPDRLHERAGPHHPRRPAAQAVRLLGGRRHPAGRDGRLRGAARRRGDARAGPRGGARRASR